MARQKRSGTYYCLAASKYGWLRGNHKYSGFLDNTHSATKVNLGFLSGKRKEDGIWKSYGNKPQNIGSINYLEVIFIDRWGCYTLNSHHTFDRNHGTKN